MIIAKVNNQFVVNASEAEALELIEKLTHSVIMARKSCASAAVLPVSEQLGKDKWAPATISIAVGI